MDPLADALASSGFLPAAGPVGQFAGADGTIVEVKDAQSGVRDLRAAVAELALRTRDASAPCAILLIRGARMSAAGLREEWGRLLTVLAPDVAARLRLVAVLEEDVVVIPDDPWLRDLADRITGAARPGARSVRVDRSFEVMRVLLSRWLLHRGRIAVGELQRQTGLSHPSVSKGLVALGPALDRHRDRSVALRAFPREAWSQLVALAPKVRQTTAFVDESGRGGDPRQLLVRLRRAPPPGVAIAGVVAARHWNPALDLEGLPRLDLSVHAPDGGMDTAFVSRLDPALVPAPRGTPPLLVLHSVPRAESMFVPDDGGVPWADPVEALLDLYELRLIEQADDLVRALRRTP